MPHTNLADAARACGKNKGTREGCLREFPLNLK